MFYEENVIETHSLSKSYGKIMALNAIDLKVPRNSIIGFVGQNGAGETSLMKILLGLDTIFAQTSGFDLLLPLALPEIKHGLAG